MKLYTLMSFRDELRFFSGSGRLPMILTGMAFIILWQCSVSQNVAAPLLQHFKSTAAFGMRADYYRFFYFYAYLGLFPLVSTHRPLLPSADGAKQIIEQHGHTLAMEQGWAIQTGGYGKLWLFYPDFVLRGWHEPLRSTPANIILFILSLLLLYVSCSLNGIPLTGICLCLFIGSQPYQLAQVYLNDNVFSLSITLMILLLAFNLRLIIERPIGSALMLIAVTSGALIGTFNHIREDCFALVLGASLLYVFSRSARWHMRLIGCLVLLSSYWVMRDAIRYNFRVSYTRTQRVVEQAGGHLYHGKRRDFHHLWHSLFLGLSDYGYDKGYRRWSDAFARNYAKPFLLSEYNISEGFEEHDEYMAILRRRMLEEIYGDPLWFLGVMLRRVGRTLIDGAPAALNLHL